MTDNVSWSPELHNVDFYTSRIKEDKITVPMINKLIREEKRKRIRKAKAEQEMYGIQRETLFINPLLDQGTLTSEAAALKENLI